LAKVDIDELGELSSKYNVQAVPTGKQWFFLLNFYRFEMVLFIGQFTKLPQMIISKLNTSFFNIETSEQLKTYFRTREVPKYFHL